jgi:cell division protein FtsB
MSRLSRYAGQARRRSPLPPRRVLAVLAAAALVLCFFLAELSLKFSVSDLERETRSLQAQRLELQSRINRVKSDVARLEKGDRLLERAEQLGMVQFVVADVEHFTVDPAIQHRYAIASAAAGAPPGGAGPPAEEIGRAIAMRLGFERPALAENR